MIKKMIITVVVLLFMQGIACADTFPQLSAGQARWSVTKKAAGFAAGFFSGVGFHELGHEVVAKHYGMTITYTNSGGGWLADNGTRSQYRNIAVAGFAMQILSTEVILRSKSIPKNNAYVLGWLAFNILEEVRYTIKNETTKGGYLDLGLYGQNGGNVRLLEAGLIAHAIWSLYRLRNNSDTAFFVNATFNEVHVGFGWNF